MAMAVLRPVIFSCGRLDSTSPRGPTVVANVASKNSRARQQDFILSRRHIGVLLSIFLAPAKTFAAETAYDHYEEESFKLDVPKGWLRGEGKVSSARKLVAFHPENDTSVNVNVIVTILGSDFTGLGSFGSPDGFAANLVSSMDRSRANPPGMTAKLLDASSRNGLYFAEYVTQSPGEAQRHLISAVGISKGEFYNKLLSVTAQYMEKDADKYKTLLEQAISSFSVKSIM